MTPAQLAAQAAAILRRAEFGNATPADLALAHRFLERAIEANSPSWPAWEQFKPMWEMVAAYG